MELVYLWVEKYKNIKNQGFNFSPRFECSYDEEKEELTINENKDYVSIFPKNINVTAIVGENGSGKSNLISRLQKPIILYYNNGNFYSNYFYNKKCNLKIKKYKDTTNHIYLDSDFIKINLEIDNDYTKFNLYKLIESEIINLGFDVLKFLENFYTLILDHNDEFQTKEIFKFNPTTIEIYEQTYSQFEYLDKLNDNYLIQQLTKEKFLVFLYSNLCMQPELDMPKIENDILSIEDVILKKNNLFKFNDITKTYELLKILDDNFVFTDFKEIYKDYKKEITELRNCGYIRIDLRDDKDRKYSNLSQGERKFFTESIMIYDAITKKENEDILVVLDEPDLSLHPQWQKKYLKELINLFSKFTNKNFHLILTSHSPYILSDLPKENVIFLEKGKQVKPFKDDEQTFGANIHTLLSHGFFMEDGLMGEFAKEKITEIFNYLKDDIQLQTIEKKDVKNIIELIGEDFLREKLLHMYDIKFPKSNEERIQELEKEIERLKNA